MVKWQSSSIITKDFVLSISTIRYIPIQLVNVLQMEFIPSIFAPAPRIQKPGSIGPWHVKKGLPEMSQNVMVKITCLSYSAIRRLHPPCSGPHLTRIQPEHLRACPGRFAPAYIFKQESNSWPTRPRFSDSRVPDWMFSNAMVADLRDLYIIQPTSHPRFAQHVQTLFPMVSTSKAWFESSSRLVSVGLHSTLW